jgi:hypothetical protein
MKWRGVEVKIFQIFQAECRLFHRLAGDREMEHEVTKGCAAKILFVVVWSFKNSFQGVSLSLAGKKDRL